MNSQIETWRVQQYASNVLHLAQQKDARLAPLCRKEMFKGKAEFFDRLAAGVAQKKTSRNADTPNLDLTHSRRMVVTETYEWATLVDRQDKLQNIHSPENEYSMAARAALGRALDDAIIAAAAGRAAGGETGSTNSYIPKEDIVASVASSAIARLNTQALRSAKYIMDKNEVPSENRFIVCRAIDIMNLLSETAVTSADYNTVRALVMGEIDTFMGFKFIRSERLVVPSATYVDEDDFVFDTTTGLYNAGGTHIGVNYALYKTCLAIQGSGIVLGMNEGLVARIEERADKSYANQVYVSMNFGAVRMEEAKVVPIIVGL